MGIGADSLVVLWIVSLRVFVALGISMVGRVVFISIVSLSSEGAVISREMFKVSGSAIASPVMLRVAFWATMTAAGIKNKKARTDISCSCPRVSFFVLVEWCVSELVW